MRAHLAVLLTLFLSGCVSISDERLGLNGAPSAAPDRPGPGAGDVYLDPATDPAVALTEHLLSQCTAEHGFALGASGAKDQGLCTGEYAAAFGDAFARGADLFNARLEVEQVKAELAALQRDLWIARGDVKTTEVNLASLALSSDRRAVLKAERSARMAAEERLVEELAALKKKLAEAEDAVARRSATAGLQTAPDSKEEGEAAAPPVLTPASY